MNIDKDEDNIFEYILRDRNIIRERDRDNRNKQTWAKAEK